VLLDTGPIVALLDKRDGDHARAVAAVEDLDAILTTCEPVLAEACYLLRAIPGAPEAVIENVERGVFRVPFQVADHAAPVRALMKKYRSVPMDLADACLVRLADLLDTGRILTLDDDFDVYRWRKNRPFERLIGRA
jgi:predicted nucleic acid-binding protein